jgi:hypothetical protein
MHLDNKLIKLKETFLSEDDFTFLSPLGEEGIDKLQAIVDQYNQRTEEGQKPVYQTMAFATQFLPNFLISKIAMDMLSPYIVGQVTNCLKPKEAAKLGQNFPNHYLAEVALHAEKLHLSKVAQELPFETAYSIMRTMYQKGYISRIGELADNLPEKLLKKFLERFNDPEEVARIMIHMENMPVIFAIYRQETSGRRNSVIDALRRLGHSDLAEKVEENL